MTFLELCQRLRSECGIAGDGPSTTVGQTKELGRLVNWVNTAYQEIQTERPDWLFMRRTVSFDTVPGTQRYTPVDIGVTDFGVWLTGSMRAYLKSAGVASELILDHYPDFNDFRDLYMIGAQRLVSGRPVYVGIEPGTTGLVLWPTPNDVYTITGEYYRSPHTLVADTDEPILPAKHHMAIVYKAMQYYGYYESAVEVIECGRLQYSKYINRLMCEQLPMPTISASLI